MRSQKLIRTAMPATRLRQARSPLLMAMLALATAQPRSTVRPVPMRMPTSLPVWLARNSPVCNLKDPPIPDFGVVVFEHRHATGFAAQLLHHHNKFLFSLAGEALWRVQGEEVVF